MVVRVAEARTLLEESLRFYESESVVCRAPNGLPVVGFIAADVRSLLECLRLVELAMGGPPAQSVNHDVVTAAVSRRLGLGAVGKAGARKGRR